MKLKIIPDQSQQQPTEKETHYYLTAGGGGVLYLMAKTIGSTTTSQGPWSILTIRLDNTVELSSALPTDFFPSATGKIKVNNP